MQRIPAITLALALQLSASVVMAGVSVIPASGNAWHVATADLDGDGRDEMVCACYDGRVVSLRDADGLAMAWEYQTGGFPFDMIVADVCGDARPETLIASSDGRLYTIGHDGSLLWKFAAKGPLYQVAATTVERKARVFAGGVDRDLYVLDSSGELIARSPRRHVVRLIGTGDLTGDGQDEVIIGYHPGRVEALDASNLELIWRQRLMDRQDFSRGKGPYRPYSMTIADLDGDSRCEIILGGSFYNGSELRVLDATGHQVWNHRESLDLKRDAGGSHTATVVTDADGDGEPDIVALNANRIVVFDRKGPIKAVADAPMAFAGIAPVCGGKSRGSVILASSPNGDDQIYRLDFGKNWRRRFARIQPQGRINQISRNLAAIRRQIRAVQYDDKALRHTVHFVTGGGPDNPAKLRSHFGVIRGFQRAFPYKNITFAMRVAAATEDVVSRAARASSREQIALSPAALVTLLRMLEVADIPFVLDVGHGCQPFVSLDTIQRILKACPETCLGFLSSEDDGSPRQLEVFMNDFWFPLMDICKKSGKKALLVEKHAWWLLVPAMKRYTSLADGTYADVLVPSVEDTNSRCPELNLAARAGLFSCGAVKAWAARTVSDEPCWNRYWQYESVMTGHPFLRRQLAQALLGATYFDYRYYYLARTDEFRLNSMGEDSIAILLDLLGKGLLKPPAADDRTGLASMPLVMREPRPRFVLNVSNLHDHDGWDPASDSSPGPFGRLQCNWGQAPCEPDSVSSVFFGQRRKGLGFLPVTRGLFPLIVPMTAGADAAGGGASRWSTDGIDWYRDGRRATDVSAADVARDLAEADNERRVVVEGHVFARVQSFADGGYRVTLVDGGYLDPEERHVHIQFPKSREPGSARDTLSGQTIDIRDGAVQVVVPAGAFRILDFSAKSFVETAAPVRSSEY